MAFILVNIDVKNNIFSDFYLRYFASHKLYAFEFNSIGLIMKIWVIWATVRVRLRFWRMEFNENQTVRCNKTYSTKMHGWATGSPPHVLLESNI